MFRFFIFTQEAHLDILNILLWILNEMADRLLYFGCGSLVVQPLSLSRRASSAAFEAALCATLPQAWRRAQRKVYLANELAVVRETLPAPGGQREILHGDLEGIFSVRRGWTMTSLGHSPIRRITRCVQSRADAEIVRVRTRFRRFVLRVCVSVVCVWCFHA